LMEAGEEFRVKPFGLEPQRVLRLEKMHVIIGQDTNAESNPLEAAMPWIVKLDKESDWIGRYAIEWYKQRGNRLALVGWEGHNGKLDVRGSAERIDDLTGSLELGRADPTDGVWTLRLSPTHAVVLCPFERVVELSERIGAGVVDMTCGWAAVVLGGPAARDVFMRSSSLDVRVDRFPPGACMAGSVMRCPSIVLNDAGRL